jgi:hypothetical protein
MIIQNILLKILTSFSERILIVLLILTVPIEIVD